LSTMDYPSGLADATLRIKRKDRTTFSKMMP
jgi:hypothetical protein